MTTVVEVLAAHRRSVLLGVVQCACGWAEPPIAHRSGTDSHERHVADALNVVLLPALETRDALVVTTWQQLAELREKSAVSVAQLDAVRGWCDLADERPDGLLHASTVRAAMDAAAAEADRG